MRLSWNTGRTVVALGGGRIVARVAGGPAARSADFDDASLLRGESGELAAALGELRTALHPSLPREKRVPLDVVLLPPLVDVRIVDLPRVSTDEARLVLAANAPRYFPAAGSDDVFAAEEGRTGRTLAAVAPRAAISALEAACEAACWHLENTIPAVAAWAASAADGWSVASLPTRLHAMQAQERRAVAIRRFPADTTAEAIAAAVGAEPRTIDPWVLAITGASEARIRLVSNDRLAQVRRAGKRRATALAALAAMCVLTAAGVHAWGLRAELEVLRRERARLAPQVQELMATRELLDRMEGRMQAFDAAAGVAPRWSHVIASVAEGLPSDAYLTRFTGVADSMTLYIVSANAASAFQAVRGIAGIGSVTALAPVRREEQPDGRVTEQVQLAARFADTETEAQR